MTATQPIMADGCNPSYPTRMQTLFLFKWTSDAQATPVDTLVTGCIMGTQLDVRSHREIMLMGPRNA